MSKQFTVRNIRKAAKRLGVRVVSANWYLRKEPGSPSNSEWLSVEFYCPCGRFKTIHASIQSADLVAGKLREHLEKDGLL